MKLFLLIGTFFVLILLGLGTVLLLNNGPKEPQQVTLTIWGTEKAALYQKTFDQFSQANPNVTIVYKEQPLRNYLTKILQRTDPNAEKPDIFLFHNTWTPLLRQLLASAPSQIINEETFKQLYYPVAASDLVIRGDVMGLPQSIDSLVMYYNQDLLNQRGLTPPQDWEHFFADATKLTVRNTETKRVIVAGAALGRSDNITYFSEIIGSMFTQQEGTHFSNIVNDKEAGHIVEYYTKFAKGNERVWDTKDVFESDLQAFTDGHVAYIFGTAKTAADITNQNSSLRFGTAKIPQLRKDVPSALATYWAWGVSKRAASPTIAWQLVWALNDPVALIRENKMRDDLSHYKLPFARIDMAKYQTNDAITKTFLDQATVAKSLPVASQTQDEVLNDAIIAILKTGVSEMTDKDADGGIFANYSSQWSTIYQQNNLPDK